MEKLITDMRLIDMGIAMAHMFVQAKADCRYVTFEYDKKDFEKNKYIGTVCINN